MIICVCKNINDNTVETYKRENKNLKQLAQDYELCSGCKKCLSTFKTKFKES